MVDVVELIREARIVVFLGADDVAAPLRVDFDAGTRKLVEDARGECAPEVTVQCAHLEHAVFRQILQHCPVEKDARGVDGNAVQIGECCLGRASRCGGKGSARRRKCVECRKILVGDCLVTRNQCSVKVADEEDVVISFFAHIAPMSVR